MSKTFELEKIADNWIEAHLKSEITEFDEMSSDNNTDEYLDIILIILEKIDSNTKNKLFSLLAAGPLEELLQENGTKIINRVTVLARQNPEFRLLLNGVWDSEFDVSVKSKLSKYMKNRW